MTEIVTGTDPATPCAICEQPLNQEDPRFTRTVHPACADKRAADYVAAGRPWQAAVRGAASATSVGGGTE
jgi:hypothetical protein